MGSGIIIKANLLLFDKQEIFCLENSWVQAPNICIYPKWNVSKYSLHILYLASTWLFPHFTKWPSESVQLLVSLPLVTPWFRIGRKNIRLACFRTGTGIQVLHATACSSASKPKDLVNSFKTHCNIQQLIVTHPKKADVELGGTGANAVSAIVRGTGQLSRLSVRAQNRQGTLHKRHELFRRKASICM